MGGYFEGWYFKHQKGPEFLAVIAGRADDGAFIQAVTKEASYRVRYPVTAYRKGSFLQIAGSRFSSDGVSLCVRRKDLELTGRIRYGEPSPIKGDIMGPFRFLPMQCRHEVVSMSHSLTGKVRLNGREIDFTGGKGYIEGDSGRSFPESYTWVQCNNFTENCSVMAAAARIPFMRSHFWGCIGAVLLNGAEYRVATYCGAKIIRRDERQLIITQKDLSLRFIFPSRRSGCELDAPDNGAMKRSIRECPCAPVYFELRQGNRILFRELSRSACYEHVK